MNYFSKIWRKKFLKLFSAFGLRNKTTKNKYFVYRFSFILPKNK